MRYNDIFQKLFVGTWLFAGLIWPFKMRMAYDEQHPASLKKSSVRHQKFKYKVYKRQSNLNGYLLFSTSSINYLNGDVVIMDFNGRMVYHKSFPFGIFDFRQWVFNNKIYYTYAQHNALNYNQKDAHNFTLGGKFVLLDEQMNEVKNIKFLPHNGLKDYGKDILDVHDIMLFSPEHYIVIAGYVKEVNNIPASLHPRSHTRVVATILQEVKNNQVVWQWDATDYPEFYTSSQESNDFASDSTLDYMHPNALTIDPQDSNLLLSMRNMNQIVKINRKNGAICWRLGGINSDFKLAEGQEFYGQHTPKYLADNRTLQWIDNGQATKRPYTRVIEAQLDETNKTLVNYTTYKIPHQAIPKRGNVVSIDSNYLICGGSAKYILLVDPRTDNYIYHMRTSMQLYRAYYAPSVGKLDSLK